MEKEIKKVNNVEETEVVEETEKEGFFSKAKKVVKKHGKKIIVGAVVVASTVAAYALGKNSANYDSDDVIESDDYTVDEIGPEETIE